MSVSLRSSFLALAFVGLGACSAGIDERTDLTQQVKSVRALAEERGAHPYNLAALEAGETELIAPLSPNGIISNGTIQLGVNPEASLNVGGGTPSTGAGGTTNVGLRYLPTGSEATAPGCLCEGWGVADGVLRRSAWANVAQGGSAGMSVVSFTSDGTRANSVVRVPGLFLVTHDFQPSPRTPNLYEVTVRIENISGDDLEDVRYTRAMDWDISPNTFSEYVTIQGTAGAANVVYADNNGFARPDPLLRDPPPEGPGLPPPPGRSSLGRTGDFVDYGPREVNPGEFGPADHGALFDFSFGALAAGESVEFKIFYGAAPTEAAALAALGAVGAEVYSFGQSNWDGTGDFRSPGGAPPGAHGYTTGAPHTFIFAFAGVGGTPINAPPTANAGPDQTLACLLPGSTHSISLDGSGSSDPEGAPLTYAWSRGSTLISTAASHTVSLPLGTHTFSLVVSDGELSSTPDSVTIDLRPDTQPPVVSLIGEPSISMTCTSSPYVDPGATAVDACFGTLPLSSTGSVNHREPGTYTITYSATDPAGYTSTATRTIEVVDTAACMPSWQYTGRLEGCHSKALHQAVRLADGRVLATGGWNTNTDIYDPATGTWSSTGRPAFARRNHSATLLPDGRVLVAGGANGGFDASAELYDPATGTWSRAANMTQARRNHTATLLPSGQVLVAGGASGALAASAELYDPASNTWTPVGSLSEGRQQHTATLLADGRVLVAAGVDGSGSQLSSSEVYDPASASWSPAGSLAQPRRFHTATLLPSGKVLVAGGDGDSARASSAELFDPATASWSTTGSMGLPRGRHTAVLLPTGKVLVAGGYHYGVGITTSAELYTPATGTWRATTPMNQDRYYHTATHLGDGRVLVTGGITNGDPSNNELYVP